ncbi:MAG: universal stress protein [Leifsonia sp.]
MADSRGSIVVGIKPGLPHRLSDVAAQTALDLGCALIFAHVEVTSVLMEWDPAEVRDAESLAPPVDEDMAALARWLEESVKEALADSVVPWSMRILGGDPATALARLADDVEARMIVVGSRRPGAMHRVEEIMGGSVAGKLVTHQERPVLVVPMGEHR